MTKASAGTRIIKSFLPVRLDKELGRKKKRGAQVFHCADSVPFHRESKRRPDD